MAIRRRRRSSLSRFIAPLATLIIGGYFGFHALNGQYGMRANVAMQGQIKLLEAKLSERTKARDELEARVSLLRDGTMEKDMVDQFVRAKLNMVREDEIVLMNSK